EFRAGAFHLPPDRRQRGRPHLGREPRQRRRAADRRTAGGKVKQINIHASCVAMDSAGVLLLGRSGAGKSDLALRLIDDGAVLVADDRVLLSARKGVLRASAPDSIRGLIEIRGLGIVTMPVKNTAAVRLAVQLGREGPRLPQFRHYDCPLALTQTVPL